MNDIHTRHHADDHPGQPDHAGVIALLPWHAAGRLEGADAALVHRHLHGCADCRAELAWQRSLHNAAAYAPDAPALPDMDAALARLLPQLEPRAEAPRRQPLRDMLAGWLRTFAPVPTALALAVLAVAATMTADRAPGYHGLGPVPVAGGDATVVFRPDTAAADVRRILVATGAMAVQGPTVAGAYILTLPPARRHEALARLRGEPAVLMAEPLDAAEAP
jgi:hypothetical protein